MAHEGKPYMRPWQCFLGAQRRRRRAKMRENNRRQHVARVMRMRRLGVCRCWLPAMDGRTRCRDCAVKNTTCVKRRYRSRKEQRT
jgi:hypothetical protein